MHADTGSGGLESVARSLLGTELHTRMDGVSTSVSIREVEAYGGSDDGASHARHGRTSRNSSMFLGPGHLYVYRIHQVVCANVVVEPPGEPAAVLIRAGEPLAGIETMARRRGRSDHLTDGPGKLCQSLGIGLHHDGIVLDESSGIWLGPRTSPEAITATPRIGISRDTDRLWRFVVG